MTGFISLAGLAEVPKRLKGAVLAIGNFDGLHRGHQLVLAHTLARARERGAPAVMLTFEPHPRDVFAPKPFLFRLTDARAKARLAEALGFDGIAVLPFSRAFSQTEAEDFVSRFLVDALAVSGVVVGADFMFGRNRRGTPAFLGEAGKEAGFGVDVLDLLDEGEAAISSSRIRECLAAGDLAGANGLLGYHWFIEGTVVVGDRRGRELGYPTANIRTPDGFHLAQGVYAVRARLGERLLDGVAAYGKPMFDNMAPPFETHLFDFSEDIYGETLSVALMGHIRGQQVFSGLAPLIEAMDHDCREARARLMEARPLSDLDRRLGFFPAT